jgi:hypothetical protein
VKTPGAIVRTEWNTPEIWLRREVTFTPGTFSRLCIRIHHDEDAELFINGVGAGTYGGYSTAYEDIPLLPDAKRALAAGRILIAVHCKQTAGGQYIDAGIVDLVPVGTVAPRRK